MPARDPSPGRIELAPGVLIPADRVRFAASRASGPGGQNVNKVSTKVELRVHVDDLPIPRDARMRLRTLAGRRITSAGELAITSSTSRSQFANRADALDRLRHLLRRALAAPTPRLPTAPTRASRRRRIESKSRRSKTKRLRARPAADE